MISGRPRPLASSSLGFIRRRDDDDNDVHVDGDDWNRRLATDLQISAVQIRGCCRSRAIWHRSWTSVNHLIIENFGRNFKCREYDTASIKRSPQPPRFLAQNHGIEVSRPTCRLAVAVAAASGLFSQSSCQESRALAPGAP